MRIIVFQFDDINARDIWVQGSSKRVRGGQKGSRYLAMRLNVPESYPTYSGAKSDLPQGVGITGLAWDEEVNFGKIETLPPHLAFMYGYYKGKGA